MIYLMYHHAAYLNKTPKRQSILSGRMWVDEIIHGNPFLVVENFRMQGACFRALVDHLVQVGGLQGTRQVSATEKVAMFLYFAGHHSSSRELQARFQHSGESITRHLRSVVQGLKKMASVYIRLPHATAPIHDKIGTNPKYSPFFDQCRMAIDGTHIPVFVPENMVARFQSRKGVTMNVLAACDFDMKFTYVLAGWEGTAGDGKLYEYALTHGLTMAPNKFDILDAGFALTSKCLTPYRGTMYHLKEFGRGRQRPRTKEELFNLRHAQLRNVIERIFGVLKKRFPVLCFPVQYALSFQVDLVIALCVVHNFLRIQGNRDDFERQYAQDLELEEDVVAARDVEVNDAPESNESKAWRDSIATSMWQQYRETILARRGLNH